LHPITQMLRVPNVLVMNADTAAALKINTLADLIAYAKANPAKLNYGSGGNGSAGHLAGEMFKRDAGIFAVHIPYNGGNPAQLALLSGQVDYNFDNLATAAPNIRAGKLKALAVTTLGRSSPCPTCRRWRIRSRALRLTPGGAWWRRPARRATWCQAQRRLRGRTQLARGQNPLRRPDGRARAHHARAVRRLHESRTRQI
jgi:hypothetical protein